MYKASHPRDDADWLYVIRIEGRKGLVSIEDCKVMATQDLEEYLNKDKERPITVANSSKNQS